MYRTLSPKNSRFAPTNTRQKPKSQRLPLVPNTASRLSAVDSTHLQHLQAANEHEPATPQQWTNSKWNAQMYNSKSSNMLEYPEFMTDCCILYQWLGGSVKDSCIIYCFILLGVTVFTLGQCSWCSFVYWCSTWLCHKEPWFHRKTADGWLKHKRMNQPLGFDQKPLLTRLAGLASPRNVAGPPSCRRSSRAGGCCRPTSAGPRRRWDPSLHGTGRLGEMIYT